MIVSSRRFRDGLLAFVIWGVVGEASVTGATAPSPWSPAPAVEYLLAHQAENGSWPPGLQVNPDAAGGITVATTALASMALLDYWETQPEKIRAAVQRGLDFVLKAYYRKPGSSGPGYGSPAWGQVYTVTFLTRLLTHAEWNAQDRWSEKEPALRAELNEAIDWLFQGQVQRTRDGRVVLASWGYAGSFHAAAAIIALQQAQAIGAKVDQGLLDQAVDYLASQWIDGKGFAYSKGGDYLKELTEREAMEDGVARLVECEWALRGAGRSTPQRFEEAFKNFMAYRDFTWKARALVTQGQVLRRGSASPYCWFAFFGYYYSTMGLEGIPAARRQPWAKTLRQDLVDALNADGTWTNVDVPKNPPPGSRIYSTAMGLMAMKHIDRALSLP